MSQEATAQSSDALVSMETLVSLCAARGFIFPSSEIYGGINGFWDYGPLGVELKNNLKAAVVAAHGARAHRRGRDRQRDHLPSPDLGGLGPRRSLQRPHGGLPRLQEALPRRPARRHREVHRRGPEGPARLHRGARLQPDAAHADRRLGGHDEPGLSASRDLPADLQRLQARARERRARRSPSASPRSARRSATRSRRATSPSARASSSRPRWSSSCTPRSASSGSSTGRPSGCASTRTSASTRATCARGPTPATSSPTTRMRRWMWSSASRSAGRRSRASTTAATGTSPGTASTRARTSS